MRGNSLASVLIVMGLVLTLAFVLAGAGMAHLNVAQHQESSQLAQEHAESVIALALQRILESDGHFGENGSGAPLELSLVEGATGRLSFTALPGVPPSLNNFSSDTARQNGGLRLVPAHSIHLVGVGTCRGVRRRVETLLFVPPFPYAIASEGPVVGERLLVGAVNEAPAEPRLDPDQLLPGHILSNSAEPEAISLGTGTTVTGNVRAPGGIVTTPDVVVRGQLESGSAPGPVPRVRLQDYDPAGREDLQALVGTPADPLVDPAPLTGFFRADQSLTVSGDLELQNGVVYVDGDLDVRGAVHGTGLVVATGRVLVAAGAALDPSNHAVLLAGRGARLEGQGKASSAFQGVVYTEGPFQAERMSLVGAFVAGPGGSLQLEDAAGIQVGDYTHLDLRVPAHNRGRNQAIRLGSTPLMVLEADFSDGHPTGTVRVFPSGLYMNRHPGLEAPVEFNIRSDPSAYLAFVQDVVLDYEAYWGTLPANSQQPGLGILQGYMAGNPPLYQTMALPPDPLPPAGSSNGWVDSSTSTGGFTRVHFDLNEFLSLEDRLRVVLWREF